MPPAACRVEERISAKVAAAAVLGRGAAGGTAGALLYDGVGAVGGRADDREIFKHSGWSEDGWW